MFHIPSQKKSMNVVVYEPGNPIDILFRHLNHSLIDSVWHVYGEYTRRVFSGEIFDGEFCEINILVSNQDASEQIVITLDELFHCVTLCEINETAFPYDRELNVNILGYIIHMTIAINEPDYHEQICFTCNTIAFKRGDPTKLEVFGVNTNENLNCLVNAATLLRNRFLDIHTKKIEWIRTKSEWKMSEWPGIKLINAINEMVKLFDDGFSIQSNETPRVVVYCKDQECSICYNNTGYFVVINCKHMFHPGCLLNYMKRNTNPMCPLCRAEIIVDL